jgi:thiol-disulfide isomerase/thioredoxin
MVQRFFLWFTVAVAVACTPQDDTSESDADIGPRDSYPSGPYGVTEGSIIAPLEFVNSDGTPFSFEEIYTDGSNQLLLIATTAGWCASCIEEQPELQRLYENYGAEGLYVLVSIFEKATFEPADSESAAQWKSQHKLGFTVVADPEFVFGDYYESSLTPMTMLVEVSSMKIIKLTTGWDPSMVQAVIEAQL